MPQKKNFFRGIYLIIKREFRYNNSEVAYSITKETFFSIAIRRKFSTA